jgi:hypothetical protein
MSITFSLLEAYEEKTTEKEKENLLSDIKFGKTQRYLPTTSVKNWGRAGLGCGFQHFHLFLGKLVHLSAKLCISFIAPKALCRSSSRSSSRIWCSFFTYSIYVQDIRIPFQIIFYILVTQPHVGMLLFIWGHNERSLDVSFVG